MPGSIFVSFDTRDLAEGPEVNCDLLIMKGYGIDHGNFRSLFQTFSFDPKLNELTIKGETYEFILSF